MIGTEAYTGEEGKCQMCGHVDVPPFCKCDKIFCGCGIWHDRNFSCDWKTIRYLCDVRDRYKRALKSIAKNTCCDKCQEAALIAKSALEGESHAK